MAEQLALFDMGGDAPVYEIPEGGVSGVPTSARTVSQEVIDQTKKEYGLDQPFLVQYAKWFAGMVTGDMGTSYVSKRDVYDTLQKSFQQRFCLRYLRCF